MGGMGRHGDGGITRRKDGRLQVSLTLTTGRRVYRLVPRLTDPKRQAKLAERVRRELVALREAEIDPGGQTVAAFLRSWLSSMSSAATPRIRASTLAFYSIIAEKHLIPVLGDFRLEDLRERHVQAWLDGLQMSPQYVSHCRAFLRRVLNVAVAQRALERNPAKAVELPPIPRYRARPMSAGEARALLDATADDRLAALWRLALVTGFRISELLALGWDDVDLERGLVSVRTQLARQHGEWVRTQPKAARDLEDVAIDPATVAMLRSHQERQAAERRDDWPYWGLVFTTVNGYPIDRHAVLYAFRAACDRAGIARRRIHDIRHSNATLLRDLGVSAEARKARLGHTSDKMAARYADASTAQDREAVERLAEAIR